jgi:hypothetical protein
MHGGKETYWTVVAEQKTTGCSGTSLANDLYDMGGIPNDFCQLLPLS